MLIFVLIFRRFTFDIANITVINIACYICTNLQFSGCLRTPKQNLSRRFFAFFPLSLLDARLSTRRPGVSFWWWDFWLAIKLFWLAGSTVPPCLPCLRATDKKKLVARELANSREKTYFIFVRDVSSRSTLY